ncbi:butyrate kinase [Clostridium formicaceticum]|uniref:Probable butyrate kinase n=1 Tax=Clostridium formicaceticum TaxID=1497 RepID=A0AAC9RMB0_9CLOT|nr:butyrate kinase [Clostridium formicaceticum]AOY75268.1 butyrate kinase [Clostridium formicaceticum]ARE89704.1 Butyrate kinase 2 [Clostridium formicaceticum]
MTLSKNKILAINPGATSTKIAVYEEDQLLFKKTIEHSIESLKQFPKLFDQYQYRLDLILRILEKENTQLKTLTAIVGRGGLLKPLAGGTYRVNEKMIEDLKVADQGEHASNLGAVIAANLGNQLNIPAFIVDPVSVDEMEPVARISGLADLRRISLSHALNMKAVARKIAKEIGKNYEEVNFIVVHLGSGVSVTPHKKGKMIDVNNAKAEGPFSPDRCGGLPADQLVKLCFSGRYTYDELREKLMNKGGLYSYFGTTDLRQVEAMATNGDLQADIVLEALAYQVAKEIGAMATVLMGQVDRIILTGGIAYSKRIVADITKRVKFIAPVVVVAGEEELESLALGALRVMRGEEVAAQYS